LPGSRLTVICGEPALLLQQGRDRRGSVHP
jgi:hypothetical protein